MKNNKKRIGTKWATPLLWQYGSLLIIAVAVLLRLVSFLRNRSLFLDTLNLARNYAEKGYLQLLNKLDYDQHAPPFFSWLTKWSTDTFGMSEYALRLFPLLTGIASILLFYQIAKNFTKDLALWFGLFLFGFSSYLFEYGTTAKQYSSDVFFACLLIYAALQYPLRLSKKVKIDKRLAAWASLGAISVWFSMPTAFVLAGVGLYFILLDCAQNKIHFVKSVWRHTALFIIWLSSFTLLYFLNLQHSIGSEHLQGFHHQFFLSFTDWRQTGEVLIGIIRSIMGKTVLQIIGGFLFLLLGISTLFKTNKAILALVGLPILACLMAAFINAYSLIIRLTLFMFPLLILLMTIGFSSIQNHLKQQNKSLFFVGQSLLVAVGILCLSGRSALPYFIQPYIKEEGRDILEMLHKENNTDYTLYISPSGRPAFEFYTKYYHKPINITAQELIFMETNFDFSPIDKQNILIFDSHTFGREKETLDKTIYQNIETRKEVLKKEARLLYGVVK